MGHMHLAEGFIQDIILGVWLYLSYVKQMACSVLAVNMDITCRRTHSLLISVSHVELDKQIAGGFYIHMYCISGRVCCVCWLNFHVYRYCIVYIRRAENQSGLTLKHVCKYRKNQLKSEVYPSEKHESPLVLKYKIRWFPAERG